MTMNEVISTAPTVSNSVVPTSLEDNGTGGTDHDVCITSQVGSNVESFQHQNLNILLWDVGGQTALRQSWAQYYTKAR